MNVLINNTGYYMHTINVTMLPNMPTLPTPLGRFFLVGSVEGHCAAALFA
jgi:hypothetical protein